MQSYMQHIDNSVNSFLKEINFQVDAQEFRVNLRKGLEFFAYSSNNWDLDLKHNTEVTPPHRKKIEESYYSDFIQYNENNLKELFDIIVLTGNASDNVDYLNDWKPMIENLHCIIIQQGNPHREIRIPSWVKYELYTKTEAEKYMGSDSVWLFDLDSNDLSAFNLGFLVADRDFIFLIHPEVKPIFHSDHCPLDILRLHAMNLMKPSHSVYFNNGVDPVHDSSGRGETDFIQGYPYNLRDGLLTAISFGSIPHEFHSDTLTPFSKMSLRRGTEKRSSESSNASDTQFPIPNSQAIPKGMMFSLSLYNLAFNRKLIGSTFCLLSHLESKTEYRLGNYYHILYGWILKTAFDHMGLGIKHFDSSNYFTLRQEKQSFSSNSESAIRKGLAQDVLWLQKSHSILHLLTKLELSPDKPKDFYLKILEVINSLSPIYQETSFLQSFHSQLKLTFEKFPHLWSQRNNFHTSLLPISKRSSYFDRSNNKANKHGCASFTIMRNDTQMFEIWLRNSARHFQEHIYVIIHYSNDQEFAEDQENLQRMKEMAKIRPFHLFFMFDNAGFPMYYFVQVADLYQRRLFRYGYQCTMLTDVDEIMVPDPDKYPHNGLTDYLTEFVQDTSRPLGKGKGFMLCHIYEVDQGHITSSPHVEPDLNFSSSLLAQRSYWYPQDHYNKPILAKIPTREKPGFHHLYYPVRSLHPDPNLILFHLREVDRNFCMEREERKFSLIKQAPQSEISNGLNGHLVHYQKRKSKGEVCQYAQSVFSEKYKKALDNTGRMTLEKMDPKWKKVVV
jgi:reversibly glycosylated polypeptide/UDP-arabinopyranose mutase